MLSFDDNPTIRWAIIKRLDKEPNIRVLDVLMKQHDEGNGQKVIHIGVQVFVGESITAISRFDLPEQFTHAHLVNEIDQMAEHFKKALVDFTLGDKGRSGAETIPGTGLRGAWPKEVLSHGVQK